MRIHNKRDFNAGLLFIAIGAFFAVYAKEYNLGTGTRMGPGYFPLILAILLSLLGLVVLIMAFMPAAEQEPAEPTDWRGLGLILGSVVIFAVTLSHAGFLIAVVSLVFLSALASPESRRIETVVLAAALATLGVVIFSYGLELQFSIFPPALTQ